MIVAAVVGLAIQAGVKPLAEPIAATLRTDDAMVTLKEQSPLPLQRIGFWAGLSLR